MNQGDVHKVMVLNTFTAVTRVRICSVARWKEPSTYHELSYTPLVLQGVNSLISQEQQCGSTVPIRRESENNVDTAVRQDAALQKRLHLTFLQSASPVPCWHLTNLCQLHLCPPNSSCEGPAQISTAVLSFCTS